LSASAIEPFLEEVAAWHIFDANVRVGKSGVHGELALEPAGLTQEMDRFGIERALVSHFAAEEYDAHEGNCDLSRIANEQLVPAWAALPDRASIQELENYKPRVVRLHFGILQHNFSPSSWCSGELFEYLQTHSVLTLIALEQIGWSALVDTLSNFPRLPLLLLETGYRADRYLFPLLERFPNLAFDTSTYLAHRQLEAFVERFGPERAVFGSRLPLYTPATALSVLGTARISEEAKRAIAGENLNRLVEGARP
jgi:Amidohydrolase